MKYRVLKECISPFNVQELCPGEVYEWGVSKYSGISKIIFAAMIQHGFIEEIKDGPWKPEKGDDYEFITDEGTIAITRNVGVAANKHHGEIGNCFMCGRGDSERALDWLKAFKVLRDDTHGFKPDWKDDGTYKYSVAYSYHRQDLYVRWDKWERDGLIYFATVPDAEESIKTHPDEWKVFLGVEEEE